MKRTTLFSTAAAMIAATGFATFAHAAATPITWGGGTSTDFEVGANWVGNTAPADDLTTNIASFTNLSPTNQPVLTQDRSIAGLSFGDLISDNTGLTLGGNFTLHVGSEGISTESGPHTTGDADTISANIDVAADQTWSIHDTELHLTGVLSGSSTLSKTASRYLYLEGTSANTFSGTLDVTNGRVYFNKSAGTTAFAGNLSVGGSNNSIAFWENSDQIADSSNVSLTKGSLRFHNSLTNKGINETFNDLNVSGGTIYTDGGTGTGATDALITNHDTTVGGTVVNGNLVGGVGQHRQRHAVDDAQPVDLQRRHGQPHQHEIRGQQPGADHRHGRVGDHQHGQRRIHPVDHRLESHGHGRK